MTGTPLLRLCLVVAGLLLLLPPLRCLTIHPARAGVALDGTADHPAPVPVHLELQSTKVPFRFELTHLGQVLWAGEAAGSGIGKDVPLAFPPEGVDLVVDASWDDGQPAVLKVSLTPGDAPTITRLLWGTGRVGDVLTFH